MTDVEADNKRVLMDDLGLSGVSFVNTHPIGNIFVVDSKYISWKKLFG